MKHTSPSIKSSSLPSSNNTYDCEEKGDYAMLQVCECAFATIFLPHHVVIMKKILQHA